MKKYFNKEQFKLLKDVYENAFLSDNYKQLCTFCNNFGVNCKNLLCGQIKRIIDNIYNNWDKEN